MKTALIMAGGTGGHIFPALAVAQALLERGWRVQWLGAVGGMECRIVAAQGIAIDTIDFAGVRAKGWARLVMLPVHLLRAFWQSLRIIRRVNPELVLGFGGYVTFPAGMMAVLLGKRLVLHEQNAIAGLSNKVLAQVADRVYSNFPVALKGAQCVGNPLRQAFLAQEPPQTRLAHRNANLRLLILGGSLGAKALNEIVPQALAALPSDTRPIVTHQSGEQHIEHLRACYAKAQVQACLLPFIDDVAQALAQADLVICRAGAGTVSEIAAVGVAALFIPFPQAVDDHQTHNARYLSDRGAATLLAQKDLSADGLAQWLARITRSALYEQACKAHALRQVQASAQIVAACEQLRMPSR